MGASVRETASGTPTEFDFFHKSNGSHGPEGAFHLVYLRRGNMHHGASRGDSNTFV